MDTLLSRITINPEICHGKPCVRGLRYSVEMLLVLAFAARLAQPRRLQA